MGVPPLGSCARAERAAVARARGFEAFASDDDGGAARGDDGDGRGDARREMCVERAGFLEMSSSFLGFFASSVRASSEVFDGGCGRRC